MSFLERLAERFLSEYGNDIHRIAFVFPTRRAGLFFQRHVREQKDPGIAIWAPPVFSVNDFMARLSGLTAADSLELIFELYDIYSDPVGQYPKAFEDFYAWGKMILADFDEIDKYLIDTGELFRNLKEFKVVEDINKDEKAAIYNRYTGFWEELGGLYRVFQQRLAEKDKAYEGMIFRRVAEAVEGLENHEQFTWDKVVFCGFNALTRAEETVIRYLMDKEKAEIYWDVDRYFTENVNQEAGYFFRRNLERLKIAEPKWVDDELSGPQVIDVIGVQSKVSQAKVLGLKLQQLLTPPAEESEGMDAPEEVENGREARDHERIAVVLPDETLLFPTLNSLPEAVERVNVTVGYPLRQTPVFSLLNGLLEMYLRVYEGGGDGFYYKDVQNVLNHPYIKPMLSRKDEDVEPAGEGEDEVLDAITAFMDEIKKGNRVYIPKEDIQLPVDPLNDLFEYRSEALPLIAYFLDLLDFVRGWYRDEDEVGLYSFDYEYIYHFYLLLRKLRDSLAGSGPSLDIRSFYPLFGDIVAAGRIPFTGEPLEGLQIMGVLETQTLDFDNLFVLSVNEGHLPPGKSRQSFIPYDVRAAMGMPTYKDRDAVSAYHFYRLLKNSAHTTLIYITEIKGLERNEKSRFIDQVLIEYAENNPNARVTHRVIDFPFEARPVKPIAVRKDDEVMAMLAKKSYSASSLLSFLTCSLKFYFTYILKLYEEEEVFESPDYKTIGHIVHKTLDELYKPFCGKERTVGENDLEQLKQKMDRVLETIFMDEIKSGDIHSGRNYIVHRVMRRLLENFFEKEKKAPGFKVLMLEEKIDNVRLDFDLDGTAYTVALEGTIDRLDERDGVVRVIDYKTGKINSLKLKSLEEVSGPEAVKRKEAFQLLLYRYLLKQAWKEKGEYSLGIYSFKKLSDELKFVEIDKSDRMDAAVMAEFEEILRDLFRDLFDRKTSFRQTEDELNCRHCPYINICSRADATPFI